MCNLSLIGLQKMIGDGQNFFLPGLEMDSKFLFFGGLVILLPLISRRLKYNHETDVKPSYNPTEL